MNRIVFDGENYTLHTEDGQTFPCKRWYEKKVDRWHVKLPKEAAEITGRTYIRESHFYDTDVYEFENKTEHRTGLSGGGWKAKMTDEEAKLVAEAEATIERIKKEASARVIKKPEKNSEEWIEMEIQRLLKLQQKYQSQK